MKPPRGENCRACGRWRPGFAAHCTECGVPAPRLATAFLADFLMGDGQKLTGTRPKGRSSARYHGPLSEAEIAEMHAATSPKPKRPPGAEAKLRELVGRGRPVQAAAKVAGIPLRTAYKLVARDR